MLEIISEPLSKGSLLANRYRLERVLGEGGMGVVWAARDENTGAGVAVKVLADDRATDPTQQARILREASAAMAISHPNVVKVLAVLETESGVPFIVMERLEGESLRARLDRTRHLDPDTTLRILGAVIDAVAAAHVAGVVHRDLKPENVFLLPSGAVKVLDFGIAKQLKKGELASLTETGVMLGTPYYMAPEQVFADEDVDARADVWSLGVMLYECLAGKRPTEADGFGPILKRITSADFEPLPDSIHPRLAALVMRMLSRDRVDRPALLDARLMLLNLDEPSPASVARSVEAAAPRRHRYGVIALAIVTTSVVLFLVQRQIRQSLVERERAPVPTTLPATSDDALRLLTAASEHHQKREGQKCLDALDAFDRLPNRPLPASTDLNGKHAGIRSMCLMLIGQCDVGKKIYREWLPIHSAVPMEPALYDQAAGQIAILYCSS